MKNKNRPRPLMTPDELWLELGAMMTRSQREEVKPDQAREHLRAWLGRKAAGESPEDLSPETVWALGIDEEEDRIPGVYEPEDPRLPAKLARLLGLKRGARYGAIFEAPGFYEGGWKHWSKQAQKALSKTKIGRELAKREAA